MRIEHYDNVGTLVSVEEVDTPDDEPVSAEDRIEALEAEVRGMKERAAAEAGKASPTAKGVAEAVTGPTA